MPHLPPLIFDLAIMLGIASIIALLFQKIGQPVVLGYLVAGIIIGPFTPPHILVNDIPNIKILSELGVIFLIFSLGLEFSFHKLVRVGFSATITGFLEVILMTAIGFGLGKIMGWSFNNALFLGAALSISSTTIIIKAIEELNLLKKRFAELIFGILIVEDLLAILLLVTLSTVVITRDFFSFNMLLVTGKLILVIGGWFLVGYFFIPSLHRSIISFANDESITIVSVSLCLLLVSLAAYLNYSIALGAFIMGSVLAETSSIYKIRILIKPIRDVFAAVFFIATGMLMNPKIVIEQWPIILIISAVTILGKIFSTGLSALLSGQSLNTSIRVGFGMAQIGEFSFIIIGLGVALSVVDDKLYPIIVAASIITTFTTPYLIRLSGYLIPILNKKLSKKNKLLLENYSSTIFRALSVVSQDNYYKYLGVRLIINGIIIAIIFALCYQLILPWVHIVIPKLWLAKGLCWVLALILSSPFIWGMIFSAQTNTKTHLNNNLYFYFFFTIFISMLEISLLTLLYFQTWIVIFYLLLIMILFFASTYQKLEKAYLLFENHLTKNINNRSKKSQKYEELAPWDTYLVEVIVGTKSEFIKKKLKDTQIRNIFGINIIAIQREQNIIFAPNGNDHLMPNDKLIILGEEESIDEFRKKIEEKVLTPEPIVLLENVILKAILLEPDSNRIGKTIRKSNIRQDIHGIVVGLERNGNRILNPDPNTYLQANDILYIAGEAKYLETLD